MNSSPRAVNHRAETTEETKTKEPEMFRSKASPAPVLWTSKCDGEVKLRLEETGVGSRKPITFHELFQESIKNYGNYYALASKEGDKWIKITYKQYYEECQKTAKSFLNLGLERFHGFIADIGAILAGGFAVGIYMTNSPEACRYVAENCGANILVVENHKQLQKILEVQHKLPLLKAIIQYGEEMKEKRPNLYTWVEFMTLGSDVPDSELDSIIESQKPNQCCTLIYTSGTAGQLKGVMLSHDNITWTAFARAPLANFKGHART
uniref:long-chain-fatty-acid--CoA ligase n=1 Tax=Sphenodon punctatus TaxID=8508 RepID=A0A8D0HRG6_SPHPU